MSIFVAAPGVRPSQITPTRDANSYQWANNGRVVKVSTMSREDLMEALCVSMDALADMGAQAEKILEVYAGWETGKAANVTGMLLG